jgi:hypothetical protein
MALITDLRSAPESQEILVAKVAVIPAYLATGGRKGREALGLRAEYHRSERVLERSSCHTKRSRPTRIASESIESGRYSPMGAVLLVALFRLMGRGSQGEAWVARPR